jgi:hypothetical protein
MSCRSAVQTIGAMADAMLPNYCHSRPLPCSMVEDKVQQGLTNRVVALDTFETFLRTRSEAGVQVQGSHCLNHNDLAMIMVRRMLPSDHSVPALMRL